jgi:parvulin-like peptidyl-prolyl isomerase
MHSLSRLALTLVAMGLAVLPAAAQAPGGVAATVNGQEVPEAALQRQLARVPPNRLAEVRKHHLETLIDNALIDQYLVQLKVAVEKKDVDAKLAEVYEEIKKQGQAVEKVFKELSLTEAELRTHLEAELRWEKFCAQQATEAELKKFFEGNREAFDGTQVRVRHILIAAAAGDAKAAEQAKVQLQLIKRQVEDAAAAAVAKVPAGADPLAKEKARTEGLEQAFAALAREKSACPSKEKGGDTDWFPRSGGMVEPFARAAFALKPYQMSEVVQTTWGYHLILATDRKPGKEVKYDDVKAEVKEVYGDRLRDAVVAYMRPRAKITINPPKSGP